MGDAQPCDCVRSWAGPGRSGHGWSRRGPSPCTMVRAGLEWVGHGHGQGRAGLGWVEHAWVQDGHGQGRAWVGRAWVV